MHPRAIANLSEKLFSGGEPDIGKLIEFIRSWKIFLRKKSWKNIRGHVSHTVYFRYNGSNSGLWATLLPL
jgi:hypothetical protein